MLEAENNRLSDNLATKVSTLKSLALDIETETNDQNRYLDGMDGEFDSTQGLLGGSVRRFDQMLKSGKHNRKLMCYLILTLLFLFIVFYFLIGHVTRG
ncbi:BET1-like protein isoform X2 [Antedon mediterranea]